MPETGFSSAKRRYTKCGVALQRLEPHSTARIQRGGSQNILVHFTCMTSSKRDHDRLRRTSMILINWQPYDEYCTGCDFFMETDKTSGSFLWLLIGENTSHLTQVKKHPSNSPENFLSPWNEDVGRTIKRRWQMVDPQTWLRQLEALYSLPHPWNAFHLPSSLPEVAQRA